MARQPSNQALETRAMIIRTAKELFMSLGYRAVSTRQIADACGLTQPALYHHFSDKQSLYVEVMRYVCEGTRAALERIIRRESDIEECLYHVTHYMIANHPEDLSRMFHDIRHELSPESQIKIYALWKNAYLDPLVSIFEEGQRDGRLRGSEPFGITPDASARLFMGLISQSLASPSGGYMNQAGAGAAAAAGRGAQGGQKDVDQQVRMLVHVLLHGLSAAEPPRV